MNQIHSIIFDLDDTLLDTTRSLVEPALRETCLAMVQAGLPGSVESCLKTRETLLQRGPKANWMESIIDTHLADSPDLAFKRSDILEAGKLAFYEREIKEDLHLMPGARDVLEKLQGSYPLFLVTAGSLRTQQKKVTLTGLASYFEHIIYVNELTGESKDQAFREMGQRTQKAPSGFLSVGNRIDTDLRPAKNLGWTTCWVKYGEYISLTPEAVGHQPDYIIENIRELVPLCLN